jgi:UPF0176 protein
MTTATETESAPRKHQVLLFYKYVTIEDPATLARWVRELSGKYSLLGRVLVAEEGINATFEGTVGNTENFVEEFLRDERFASVHIKRSAGTGNSFPNLSVKVRNQIVGTRFSKEEVDPRVKTASYLSPDELRQWYEEERDFTVIDMRNDYEFASGHFKNAVEPGIRSSRELPDALPKLEALKHKKVVTVCTGGIRCESMAAYLLSKGFTDVHQLEGGIHSYMEKYPGKDFLGTLYTFDQRLTMDFGGEREVIGVCHLCGGTTEQYADCAHDPCHYHFLACRECRDSAGRAFCSAACRSAYSSVSVLTKPHVSAERV